MVKDLNCPHCQVNTNVVKLGKDVYGRRRYACKDCKKSFYDVEGEKAEKIRILKEQIAKKRAEQKKV